MQTLLMFRTNKEASWYMACHMYLCIQSVMTVIIFLNDFLQTEDCVDGPIIEGPETSTESPVSASPPLPQAPRISPPIINITLTDPPITNGSPRHQTHRSSSSRSTLSETSAELSSFDTSIRVKPLHQTFIIIIIILIIIVASIIVGNNFMMIYYYYSNNLLIW